MWNIKCLIDEKAQSEVDWLSSMAKRMQWKFDKYWGGSNLLLSIASILDPRDKMRMINFCYKEMYSPVEADAEKSFLKQSLSDLYKEYLAAEASNLEQNREKRSTMAGSNSAAGASGAKDVSGRAKYDRVVEEEDDGIGEDLVSELDTYLSEKVFKCQDKSVPFDAIGWWKANSLKFKVLSKTAVEILSIPITTVASESTFSAGGRVIDTYRASLGTDTVEALLCGNDWFRSFYNLKRKGKAKVSVLLFICIFSLCYTAY